MDYSQYPYATRRMPVYGASGAVATSQPLAAQAGLQVLRDGGNAVDAAIATAAALTVVEPTSNGLGSDAFALVWDGQKLHGLNASGRSAAGFDAEPLRDAGNDRVPNRGWTPVTVPGAVDAWGKMSERFGKLSMERLLAPAAEYAEEGYPVSPVVQFFWSRAAAEYGVLPGAEFDGWRQAFLRDGAPPSVGQRWFSPGHARTLRRLAAAGTRDFYDGEIAAAIDAHARATGGALRAEDLQSHHAEWVDPISMDYRDHTVWEIPPNGSGIIALQALGMIDGFSAGGAHVHADAWHQQIEAMKLAYSDGRKFVADQDGQNVPVAGMLDPDYLAGRRDLIGDRAQDFGHGKPPGGGTIYLCTADRDGMMVSFIQSNYEGFGSGVVVPDWGISMQNRGHGFSLERGHLNEARPGRRPYHTIIPSFLTRGDEAVGPFGVMGGFMQPQGHLQVTVGTVDHGLNAQSVLDAPRWRAEQGLTVSIESTTPRSVVDALRSRGHEVQFLDFDAGFGRGQIIWRRDDGCYEGGTEPRADGLVAAY